MNLCCQSYRVCNPLLLLSPPFLPLLPSLYSHYEINGGGGNKKKKSSPYSISGTLRGKIQIQVNQLNAAIGLVDVSGMHLSAELENFTHVSCLTQSGLRGVSLREIKSTSHSESLFFFPLALFS